MFARLILLGCYVTTAIAIIALNMGYVVEKKVWPEYVNETRTKVQEKLSEIFPNVEFKMFRVQELEKHLEEFYFERIKIVVDDDDVVVEAPEFYGQIPDFTFAKKILGKKWQKAKVIVENNVPSTTIVVEQNNTRIFEQQGRGRNYILLQADEQGLINEMPEYVRVLPNRNE